MNGQGKSLKDKEFTQDKNFAPKQNERDCPMTNILSQGKGFYPVLGQKNYPVDAQLDRKFQPVSNIKLT